MGAGEIYIQEKEHLKLMEQNLFSADENCFGTLKLFV
jgi:hypothetical protein